MADPFRIRDHVADFDAIVGDIVARSEKTRASLPMTGDLRYGDGDAETLDIFFPAERRPGMPVHMFIHGGYWRMFSKRDYSCVADTVTSAGAIAVIVDYALMPSVRMGHVVDQIRRARDWVQGNIAAYGGDPERFSVSGHSAGAHLATWLFTRDQEPCGLRAALLLGGIYDLEPLRTSFLQREISLTEQEVAAFTPMRQDYAGSVQVSVLVGAEETSPFHQQAEDFFWRLRSQGVAVKQSLLPARNHMTSVRDLAVAGSSAARALGELLRGV